MHLMGKIKCYLTRITVSCLCMGLALASLLCYTSEHFIFSPLNLHWACPLLKLLHGSFHGALSKLTNISSVNYQIKCWAELAQIKSNKENEAMTKKQGPTVTTQGTVFNRPWKTIMEKNMKNNMCVCVYTVIYRDSILKSGDISLPKKVCLVKAMVFSVVMYGCESWTIENYVSLWELDYKEI